MSAAPSEPTSAMSAPGGAAQGPLSGRAAMTRCDPLQTLPTVLARRREGDPCHPRCLARRKAPVAEARGACFVENSKFPAGAQTLLAYKDMSM